MRNSFDKVEWAMMSMGAVVVLILVLMVGWLIYSGIDSYLCDGDKPNAVYEHPGMIQNISFVPAHQEEHCSKGCSYSNVPDKWYLKVCSDEAAKHHRDGPWCHVFSITHGPWDWQTKGAPVTIISHQPLCDRQWYYYGFKEPQRN